MITSFGVVLDACVIFPAYLRDALLTAAHHDLYRPLWSAEILDEMQRNLTRRQPEKEANHVKLRAAIQGTFPQAMVAGYEDIVPSMTNHEGDRHVLAAAVKSHAQVIVTSNLKHFPPESAAPFDIEIQHPDDFLLNLYDLEPRKMLECLIEQSMRKKRPSLSLEELLLGLGKTAPNFAAAMLTEAASLQ